MIKFLKFSFTIINLSFIKQIDIKPEKYDIHLCDNEFTPLGVSNAQSCAALPFKTAHKVGVLNMQRCKGSYNFLKIGDLSSKSSKIEISKITHPNDYKKNV